MLWLEKIRAAAAASGGVDMVMVGDFGKDQDDEKALVMAVSMRKAGLVRNLTVIANLADAHKRARLAKGTLSMLGAGDVPVAAGTNGGRADEVVFEHEFDCPYMADDAAVDSRAAADVFFSALEEAAQCGRKVCVALNSSLTDMAGYVEDPRWVEVGAAVSVVSIQAGVVPQDGALVCDDAAANCAFDTDSAQTVFSSLQRLSAACSLGLVVCSRHAAGACKVPKQAVAGPHPIAKRLQLSAKSSLRRLWQRTHMSPEDRQRSRDSLPARCNPEWFRKTFLLPDTPPDVDAACDVWEHIAGFNEYDGLATVAGALLGAAPAVFLRLFEPDVCPQTGTLCIGVSAERTGVRCAAAAADIMHELMADALAAPQHRDPCT